jgi:hypothetical protein
MERPAVRDAHRTGPGRESTDLSRLDARRREVQALLDSIRDPAPQPADILQVVQDATGDALNRERLGRIEAGIRALYAAD